jgi:hypothetical protein
MCSREFPFPRTATTLSSPDECAATVATGPQLANSGTRRHLCLQPCSSESVRPWTLRRPTVVGEVPQPGVHRRELRFEIGDRPPDVRRRFPELALVLARAMAQGGDRDRDPADTMLKALALELSTQCVGGGGSRGAHRCGARSVRGLALAEPAAGRLDGAVGLPVAAGAQQQLAGDAAGREGHCCPCEGGCVAVQRRSVGWGDRWSRPPAVIESRTA